MRIAMVRLFLITSCLISIGSAAQAAVDLVDECETVASAALNAIDLVEIGSLSEDPSAVVDGDPSTALSFLPEVTSGRYAGAIKVQFGGTIGQVTRLDVVHENSGHGSGIWILSALTPSGWTVAGKGGRKLRVHSK